MNSPLDDVVDITKVLKKLHFAEEYVSKANLNQPMLMLEASKYKVQMFRTRVAIETRYNLMRARKAIRFRQKYNSNSSKPLTEPALKALLDRDGQLYKLQKKLNKAEADETLAKDLLEVYRQRQTAVKLVIEQRKIETSKGLIDAEKMSQLKKHRVAARMLGNKFHKDAENDDDE